jgi:hypothetical protein
MFGKEEIFNKFKLGLGLECLNLKMSLVVGFEISFGIMGYECFIA